MKKLCLVLCVVWLQILPRASARAQDPIALIIQQGIKKVIVAVDLKIQRMQNKVIWLQNAQKVIENTVSKLRLDEITDWVERQRMLYQDYFDELWKVKDAVRFYHKVKEVVNRQVRLVQEYNRAWRGVQQDGHFTPDEVVYVGTVYSGILQESVRNLDQVLVVIQSFSLQVSDGRRLALIDAAAAALEQNCQDLKTFTDHNIRLSLQRAKDAADVATIRRLYGVE